MTTIANEIPISLNVAKHLLCRPSGKIKSRSFSTVRLTTFLLLLACTTGVSTPTIAQAPRKLTLREAAQFTLQNSRAIQLAAIGVERASAEHAQAKSIFRPEVLLGSGLAYSKGFPLSIEGSAPSIDRKSTRLNSSH